MADLLPSLLVPNSPSPRSSQESFRSFASEHPADAAVHNSSQPQAKPTPSTSSASGTFQASALQAAGLPVYDIESYLNDPKNSALHANTGNGNKASKKSAPTATNAPEPVSLGTKTSFHTAALNTQCQSKGFLPVFDLDGSALDGGFTGVLKLGDITVTSDQRWRSKKEAREGLAEKGLATVQGMDAKKKEPGAPVEPGRNWIGMLHEYHNLINPNLGPLYHDYALGSAFASTCIIPSLPSQTFGSTTSAFSSKKAARSNAAREAVEHLIAKGELNADGSTKSRKKVKLGTAVKVQGRGLEVSKDTTYAQKVNDICPILGLAPPQYVLAPTSPLAPNMLSGYATFMNAPHMATEIGEARNVFGKKNAKEEVAKGVWESLRDLAAKRGVRMEEREGDEGDGSLM